MNKLSKGVLIILLTALILRLLLFAVISFKNPDRFLQPDSYSYLKIAENIVNHRVYSHSSSEPFLPGHSRTPLYPFFTALFNLFNLGVKSIIFFQILLSAALCLLVMGVTYKLSSNVKTAYVAGLFVAVDIPTIVLSNSILTETLFTFLLFLSVFSFIFYLRNKNIILLITASIFMGLATLCRPIVVLLPYILAVILIFQKSTSIKTRAITAGLFLLIYVLTLSPWLIRNKIIFGVPFLSTIGAKNLLYYQAANVKAGYKNIPIQITREQLKKEIYEKINDEQADIMKIKNLEKKLAISIILKHPFIYMQNHIRFVFNMLFFPIRSDLDLMLGFGDTPTTITKLAERGDLNIYQRFIRDTSFITVLLVVFQMLFLIILYGTIVYGVYKNFTIFNGNAYMLLLGVVVYFAVVSSSPDVYARFRVPIMPFLAILSAIGIVNPRQGFFRAEKK